MTPRPPPQVAPGQGVRFTTRPDHAWRAYDAASGAFLGAAFVIPSPSSCEPGRQLRTHFGFDGFIGPSLRDAVDAFEAADMRATVENDAAIDQAVVIV